MAVSFREGGLFSSQKQKTRKVYTPVNSMADPDSAIYSTKWFGLLGCDDSVEVIPGRIIFRTTKNPLKKRCREFKDTEGEAGKRMSSKPPFFEGGVFLLGNSLKTNIKLVGNPTSTALIVNM